MILLILSPFGIITFIEQLSKVMEAIVLKSFTEHGEALTATFLPEKGMNLASFMKDELEAIDQSTKGQFEERFAGLGALIGPHFHRRTADVVPKIKREELFPHIARVKAKGIADPFSHGIGRYAPWKVEQKGENSILATLNGKDSWNGVPLAELEGQEFAMTVEAELSPKGLTIALSVVSSADSLIGTHHYYHLPQGRGKLFSRVQRYCIDRGERQNIPEDIALDDNNQMIFSFGRSIDCAFYPYGDRCCGEILLDAESYKLAVRYVAPSAESCWNLYHPYGASFVCIEPISAQDPRHPNLTVSGITIQLQIL